MPADPNAEGDMYTQYVSSILQSWLKIKELTVQMMVDFFTFYPENNVLAQLISESLMLAVELLPKLKDENKKKIEAYLTYFQQPYLMLEDTKDKTAREKILGLVQELREALESLKLTQYELILG